MRERDVGCSDERRIGGDRDRIDAWSVGHRRLGGQHVLGQCEHHRAWPSRHREPPGVRHVLGNPLRPIDLRRPLGDAAVHAPVVDLLERLAIGQVGADLADQNHHRRRVLLGCVNADRGIRGARATRDQRNARPTGQLAAGLGHVGGATFVPADDEAQTVGNVMQCVEHREEALAGHAEGMRRALCEQARDEDLAAGADFHGAWQASRMESMDFTLADARLRL